MEGVLRVGGRRRRQGGRQRILRGGGALRRPGGCQGREVDHEDYEGPTAQPWTTGTTGRCLQDTAGEDAGATDAKTLMEIWAFAKPQSAPPSSPTQLCQLEVSLKLCFRHIFNEDKLNKFRKSLCPFI